MNEEKWNDETHEEYEIDIEIEEHEGEKPHKMMKKVFAGPRGHGSPFDLEEGFFPPGKHHRVIKRRGGPVLAHLMYQAKDMGVNIYACYTSMVSMGLTENELIGDIRAIRMSEFLEMSVVTDSQFVI